MNRIFKRKSIPLASKFWSIRRQHYSETNDCSNKAAEYCRALVAAGYTARVTVVRPKVGSSLHAIVQVSESLDSHYTKSHWYDPTVGTSSNEVSDFGSVRYIVEPEDLGKYGNEFV